MRGKEQEATAKIKPRLPRLLPLVLVIVLALLVSCCGQAPASGSEITTPSPELTTPSYINITPEEAHEMVSHGGVVVLDVRTPQEYNSGHISDALLIPLSELESRLDELNPSDHILVYCKTGVRSAKAAGILVDNGFIHVYNMEGGITQWQAHGFPVTQTEESSCGCH